MARATFTLGRANGQRDIDLREAQYDRAIQDFDQAIRINPNFAHAYNGRGLAYSLARAEYDRAIQDVYQAIRINTNLSAAFLLRSLAKRAKGDSVGAAADLAKSKQLTDSAMH